MPDEVITTPPLTKSEHENFAEYMDQYNRRYGRAYRFELNNSIWEMEGEPPEGDPFSIKLKDDEYAGELRYRVDLWISQGKKPVRRIYFHEDQIPKD